MADETNEPEPSAPELELNIDFAPDWARKPAEQNFYSDHSGRDSAPRSGGRGRGGPRDGGRGRGDDRGGNRGGRGDGRGRDAQRSGRGDNRGGPRSGGGRPEGRRPGGGRKDGPGAPRGGGPRRGGQGDRGRPPRRDYVQAAAVEVRFLPQREQLNRLADAIVAGKRAVPLTRVAGQFLAHPDACDVLIRPEKDATFTEFAQCPSCGYIALKADDVAAHIARDHIDDYFDVEERESEPPKGNFVLVARCGLSKTLLGPPNHHSYRNRVSEVRAANYPNMSPDAYQAKIEMLRDPELIDQWKEEACKQSIYRLKGDESGREYTWSAASLHMRQAVAASAVRTTKSTTLSATVAKTLDDRGLQRAVHSAWERERRFPATLMFSLRGALGHKHLHIFRLTGKAQYVSPIAPTPLKQDETVDDIAAVLKHISEHRGCSHAELRTALRPDLTDEHPDEVVKFFYPLLWLIERGHVIEFFDGTLAVPTRATAPRKPKHDAKHGDTRSPTRKRRPRRKKKPSGDAPKADAPKQDADKKAEPEAAPADAPAPEVTDEAPAPETAQEPAKENVAPAPEVAEAPAPEAAAPEAAETPPPAPEA